ncbi:MAG: thioredoxin 1 [Myxococcota bacterium]|jgi:thioredoxin 1
MEIVKLHAADYYPLLDARQAPSLVIFTGPACGACRRLKSIIAAMPPMLDGLVVFEVDAQVAGGLVEELEIFHLPALFLYARGDYHAPVQAELRAASLAEAVAAAAAGQRQEPP